MRIDAFERNLVDSALRQCRKKFLVLPPFGAEPVSYTHLDVYKRQDYESVLTEEKLVQREANEKKCELTTTFQSDQSIR